MSDFLTVLAYAALPALGNFAGGLVSELFRVSERALNLMLHVAVGVVLAVVAVELIPTSFQAEAPWVIILCFVAGGGFYIAVDWALERWRERKGMSEESAGPMMVFFSVAVDLFSDGVMIGSGSTVGMGLGLLLALGQVPADIPEGFAAIATLKKAGVARSKRLLLAAAFALPILLGATLGYWAVRDAPPIYKLSLLSFTAGILLTAVVEDFVPEAHRIEDIRLGTFLLIGGFALFSLLSAYLE